MARVVIGKGREAYTSQAFAPAARLATSRLPPPRTHGHDARHMIAVEGLTKLYGDVTAVSDLTFTVEPGKVMGLVGPNGAGKTTALRCISGIIPATHGRIVIEGCDLQDDPIAAKKLLAFFPDEPRLFDYLTVRQHLETGVLKNSGSPYTCPMVRILAFG